MRYRCTGGEGERMCGDSDKKKYSIHREALHSYTSVGVDEAYARGKKWVQRNVREWPVGHKLDYVVDRHSTPEYMYFMWSKDLDTNGNPKSRWC
jgi:hypothetical protein